MQEWVEVAYVARAHGVRGELRMHPHDPESTVLDRAEQLRIGGVLYQVASSRPVPGGFLIRLDGLFDRDRAEAMRGQTVEVLRDDLELEEGDYLLADLIGCAVVTQTGEALGQVVAIENGPQARLVVRDQRDERLIPVVDELLAEIDLEEKRIVVDLPEGLPSTPIGLRGRP